MHNQTNKTIRMEFGVNHRIFFIQSRSKNHSRKILSLVYIVKKIYNSNLKNDSIKVLLHVTRVQRRKQLMRN